MILGGDFMILNGGLCYENNEKQKKNNIPIYSFWDMVNLKYEKGVQKIFLHPILMTIFFSSIQKI